MQKFGQCLLRARQGRGTSKTYSASYLPASRCVLSFVFVAYGQEEKRRLPKGLFLETPEAFLAYFG